MYLQNRSLIIDEANLARNLSERSVPAFFENLDYEQYAPPFFLVASKAVVEVWGNNEFALRLIPLLSGIFSLFLLFMLAKKLKLNNVAKWYILLLFVLSPLTIRYGTEFKQYASDTFLALICIYLAVKDKSSEINGVFILRWSLIGVILIWCSMPIVFILAGIALSYFYLYKKSLKNLALLTIVFFSWLGSFLIYYFLILDTDIQSDYLRDYHSTYFFNLFPSNLKELEGSYKLIISVFRTVADKTTLSIILSISTFCFGITKIFKSDKFKLILFTVPILAVFIASSLKQYSLIPRLTLFLVPIFLIVIGIGITKLWSYPKPLIKIVIMTLILLSLINKEGYKYVVTPMKFEESRPILFKLMEHRKNEELIIVHHDAKAAFFYYNDHYTKALDLDNFYISNWDTSDGNSIRSNAIEKASNEFWLFICHTFPPEKVQEILDIIQSSYDLIEKYTDTSAGAYRFRLTK